MANVMDNKTRKTLLVKFNRCRRHEELALTGLQRHHAFGRHTIKGRQGWTQFQRNSQIASELSAEIRTRLSA